MTGQPSESDSARRKMNGRACNFQCTSLPPPYRLRDKRQKSKMISTPRLESCGPVVEGGPVQSNYQAVLASSVSFLGRHLPVFLAAIAGCGAVWAVVDTVGIQCLIFLGPWPSMILVAWIINLRCDDVFDRLSTLHVLGLGHKNLAHVCGEECSGKRISLREENSGNVYVLVRSS